MSYIDNNKEREANYPFHPYDWAAKEVLLALSPASSNRQEVLDRLGSFLDLSSFEIMEEVRHLTRKRYLRDLRLTAKGRQALVRIDKEA